MINKDTELVEGIKKGYLQRRRFEAKLFHEYQYFVQQAAHKYPLTEVERQSAYSDAFMAFIQQILDGRFRGESSTKTFFYSIFNNKCIDAVRKNTTNKMKVHDTEWVEDWGHLSSRATNALKSIIQKEMVEEVELAFSKLGDKCLTILTKHSRGYSAQELADMLGYKNAQTVRMTKSRCMDKLLGNEDLKEKLE